MPAMRARTMTMTSAMVNRVWAAMIEPQPSASCGAPRPRARARRAVGLSDVEGGDQRDQRGDADDDARHHDGDIDQRVEAATRSGPVTRWQRQRRHGAEQVAQRRRGGGDDQAVARARRSRSGCRRPCRTIAARSRGSRWRWCPALKLKTHDHARSARRGRDRRSAA